MKVYFALSALVITSLCISSCTNNTSKVSSTAGSSATAALQQVDTGKNQLQTEEAKKWLIAAIEDHFKLDTDMATMTTETYNAYKIDAMNVDMQVDNSLSEEEFNTKWAAKFDTATHINNIAFLISGQDYDQILVKDCEALPAKHNRVDTIVFKTTLMDKGLHQEYHRKIFVTHQNGKYLIADVLEED